MRRDEGYLLDMLIAARDARLFVSGLTRRQFDESQLHQNAVVKALEIIGEAAGRISDEGANTSLDRLEEFGWYSLDLIKKIRSEING